MQQWTAEEDQRPESLVRGCKHWNEIVVELSNHSLEECKGRWKQLNRRGGVVQGLKVAHIWEGNAKSATGELSTMGEES